MGKRNRERVFGDWKRQNGRLGTKGTRMGTEKCRQQDWAGRDKESKCARS